VFGGEREQERRGQSEREDREKTEEATTTPGDEVVTKR